MGQPIPNTSQTGNTVDYNALILSPANATTLVNQPADLELSTVRQIIETLFARVDALQQNQAVQLAGVHDRLDAVELELPLIQEQGALRVRDREARMTVEIDAAARAAVDEATSVLTVALQEEVSGKFSALAAQMETQSRELGEMRESKKLADARLNRTGLDIERLCGNLAARPDEELHRLHVEPVASPFRSRIAEHIRQAAVDMAPSGDNPLVGEPRLKKPGKDWAPANPAASHEMAARTAADRVAGKPALVEPPLARPAAKASGGQG